MHGGGGHVWQGGHAWQGGMCGRGSMCGGGACMAFWRQVTMFFFVNFKNDKTICKKLP